MTQWVENPGGGRDRGPVAVARAWAEALVRPRRLFRTAVAPGDQAPGLVFAATVVGIEEATRFLLIPDAYPVLSGRPAVSGVFWLLIAVVLVAPAVLHLVAALQTLSFLLVARVASLLGGAVLEDRAGVSETVQVLAYASAPCVFAGVPIPAVRIAAAVWGSVLLLLGLAEVHDLSVPQSAPLSVIPGTLVFGYGFRGVAAVNEALAGRAFEWTASV